METQDRVRQVLEAQLGNMIVQMAQLTVQLEVVTAERDALKQQLDAQKPDGTILSPV